jgi:hypothetical protein
MNSIALHEHHRAAKAAPSMGVAYLHYLKIRKVFEALPDLDDTPNLAHLMNDAWGAVLTKPIYNEDDETAALKLCVEDGHVDPGTALRVLRRVLRHRATRRAV